MPTVQTKTGTEVEFKLFSPADIYSQKVIAAARAGNLPDIFGILGENALGSFVVPAYFRLNPLHAGNSSEWKQRFYPKTIEVVTLARQIMFKVKEGVYGVPIDTTVINFVYNKSLLKGAGWIRATAKNF